MFIVIILVVVVVLIANIRIGQWRGQRAELTTRWEWRFSRNRTSSIRRPAKSIVISQAAHRRRLNSNTHRWYWNYLYAGWAEWLTLLPTGRHHHSATSSWIDCPCANWEICTIVSQLLCESTACHGAKGTVFLWTAAILLHARGRTREQRWKGQDTVQTIPTQYVKELWHLVFPLACTDAAAYWRFPATP